MSAAPATAPVLDRLLARRLDAAALAWVRDAAEEVRRGVDDDRFCALLSLASRHVKRRPLAPDADGLAAAAEALPGWTPERWNELEAARVALVLARGDLAEPSGERALAEAFRYADEGELCALYRSLAHLPAPERFVRRAAEGCRTNMRSVFEATALDTPYPARLFDDVAWRQAAIKAVFVEAPLWRLHGLDGRLSEELARMALDLADERRSAGRPVQRDLWLCLGPHGGERALGSIERELDQGPPLGRRAAAYALGRAGAADRLRARLEREEDPAVAAALRDALAGRTSQDVFRALDPEEPEAEDPRCASSTRTST